MGILRWDFFIVLNETFDYEYMYILRDMPNKWKRSTTSADVLAKLCIPFTREDGVLCLIVETFNYR